MFVNCGITFKENIVCEFDTVANAKVSCSLICSHLTMPFHIIITSFSQMVFQLSRLPYISISLDVVLTCIYVWVSVECQWLEKSSLHNNKKRIILNSTGLSGWHHAIETLSALLAVCETSPQIADGFSKQTALSRTNHLKNLIWCRCNV